MQEDSDTTVWLIADVPVVVTEVNKPDSHSHTKAAKATTIIRIRIIAIIADIDFII
jgi:hypothetical protein